ncbi:MAG: sugar phosphate isomerase/epimerase [Clostridia bacterium]|nr:sugar phosphate isomerase/epimerase [Clostridia bacterium]
MKRSINAWAFPDSWDFEKVFKTASELGFECIELNLDCNPEALHSFGYESDETVYAKVRELIKKYNVGVESVSTGQYWSTGAFGSNDPAKSAEALKVMRKQIEVARGIGADTILIVTSLDADTGYKKSFENTIALFKSLESEIKEGGINIGLENVWNQFFLSPHDALYVLDAINNPLVGIYFDAGNMLEFGKPEWWIETIGKYIKKVHIKDFKKGSTYHLGGEWCALFKGDADFESLIPALKAAGYDGPISAELFNDGSQTPEEFLGEIADAMKKIVK